MIKVENIIIYNIDNAIKGMRNPLQSWDKSDSEYVDCLEIDIDCNNCPYNLDSGHCYGTGTRFVYMIGEKDLELAMKLVRAGAEHRKFLRQIFVSMDITAPLYWWKEMDTYKVGTTANSTSTMHTLHKRPLTIDDFSFDEVGEIETQLICKLNSLIEIIQVYKDNLQEKEKYWRRLIQLLPSSFNQMRTWTSNYEVLRNIYHQRKNHKLSEWKEFCRVLETLPYSQFITVGGGEKSDF